MYGRDFSEAVPRWSYETTLRLSCWLSTPATKSLAKYHGVKPEPWMNARLWGSGRHESVGCSHCAEGGPEAGCWGLVGCHGFWNGCGCLDCSERDLRESLAMQTEVA